MSFDLMVFEPSAAPRTRAEFMRWYQEQAEWSEDHSYDDPAVTSPALQNWFAEMIQYFPPLNGPLAVGDDRVDDLTVTDHCIGRNVIYSAFRWDAANEAFDKMRELAIKHGVGFFHASDDEGEILFPGNGTLAKTHRPWWKIW
ncbi:hypothetical protein GTP45_09570 [Pseudoduganella sp. FT55W]|uniref:Uncharacterized protein n=1 Tax=Duganella rivi TaxID=2666083 RepID=A0A7X4GP71_9BURK|nr:hypothetical protein [Duganella rivi]MYM67076.1 hypothetical protein [Duganella rivi]